MDKESLAKLEFGKLLVVCGPTSTGKTALAVSLAKKFNGEIISADSRQVYKGLDIGTGKDLPKGARIKYPWFYKWGYYEIDGVKLWGYDLVGPRQNFSISQYLKFAEKVVEDVLKRKKLPIMVGGSGFYIKGFVDGVSTVAIPQNKKLREVLEGRKASDLYENLSQIDALRAASLNSSDKKNPRRLIRAIEVASWKIDNSNKKAKKGRVRDLSLLMIGLTAPKGVLSEKVEERVNTRIRMGIKKEIARLLKSKVSWKNQSMLSLGYRQWRDFFEGKRTESEVIEDWKAEEKKYAKRQLTWFKKDGRINWFDITDRKYVGKVENSVKRWYKQEN